MPAQHAHRAPGGDQQRLIDPSVVSCRVIAAKLGQSRAARPVPPYTTRSCGRSVTSRSPHGPRHMAEMATTELPRRAPRSAVKLEVVS